jgi:DNA repair protein RadA/Sms
MSKEKRVWICSQCGNRQVKWTGSCSLCQEWNTFKEEIQLEERGRWLEGEGVTKSLPIKSIDPSVSFQRISLKMAEMDRLLGGGLVAGSLILVGGDPGIGKSTLLLQIAHALAEQKKKVLYISGEESLEQTSLRAHRLNALSDDLFLFSDTLFSQVQRQIEELRPTAVIIDSIQILYKSEIPSSPGSVAQVREMTADLMRMAKKMNIAIFLIGHVTKTGEIAGPRVLEHLVDVVLEFDGDRQQGYRFLRANKNRFGPTDDVAVFQMGTQGFTEVANPSLLFLEGRSAQVAGSAIIPTIEGTRAFLIEVQALVASSSFATSTRRSTGLDQNRLALLLAVLEKRMGYPLYRSDVFVSIAGGLKIVEPAIDLGILIAIASSFCNHFIDPRVAIIGEVGLGGEVRPVPRIESRIKEAIHMGFQACLLPKRNLQGLSKEWNKQIQLQGVEMVEEAVEKLMNSSR